MAWLTMRGTLPDDPSIDDPPVCRKCQTEDCEHCRFNGMTWTEMQRELDSDKADGYVDYY